MSVHKLSAQQTLGLLIKKRNVAFKRAGCVLAMQGGGYTSSFNITHVWRVIYKRRVDSLRVVLCGNLAAIVHCHAAVMLPSTRNMTAPWARLHVVLSASSFLFAAAAAQRGRARLYSLHTPWESIVARWTPPLDLLVRLSRGEQWSKWSQAISMLL